MAYYIKPPKEKWEWEDVSRIRKWLRQEIAYPGDRIKTLCGEAYVLLKDFSPLVIVLLLQKGDKNEHI